LSTIEDSPTILFEDNAVCITQLRGDCIKEDRTKYISPKFFYTHELQQKKNMISNQSGEVIV
jgi:hypothetical protein